MVIGKKNSIEEWKISLLVGFGHGPEQRDPEKSKYPDCSSKIVATVTVKGRTKITEDNFLKY